MRDGVYDGQTSDRWGMESMMGQTTKMGDGFFDGADHQQMGDGVYDGADN